MGEQNARTATDNWQTPESEAFLTIKPRTLVLLPPTAKAASAAFCWSETHNAVDERKEFLAAAAAEADFLLVQAVPAIGTAQDR